MAIPRTIHYCWFGRARKPKLVAECIDSWRRYLPDFEIVEWTEANYDVYAEPYTAFWHLRGNWAFVSDYVRFDVLAQHGGIYLDTDVELLRPFPEDMLQLSALTAVERSGLVSPGLIFGCEAGHWLAKAMLHSYRETGAVSHPLNWTVNRRITAILESRGFVKSDTLQCVDDVVVYPSEVFCGYDQDVHRPAVTTRAISVHHYAGSWLPRRARIKKTLQMLVQRLVGVSIYRRILQLKRSLFGVNEKI